MTEAQVGFLYKIAAAVSHSDNDKTSTLLKSYYLMRCNELTRGFGLPDKHFSSTVRCPKCCIEWKNNTEVKIKSIKLSKRQKQRLNSRKVKENKKAFMRRKKDLLHSNQIEQICTFCNKSTITNTIKPQKETTIPGPSEPNPEQNVNFTKAEETVKSQKLSVKANRKKYKDDNQKTFNVYANALDVFSLENKNNSLVTKEKPKVINNNKKKKDKFAGLCQKAVLASAKLKGIEDKKNKLNLFLKPSV
uniref:Uncharacterized protein n=1 Tax=Heliothis virescens TaxID=7102 RepID=A0A2A4ITI9_HELVI